MTDNRLHTEILTVPPIRIGRFGIQVEHIFHTGDVIRVDLGNAPHVFAPWLDILLSQASTHRLSREAIVRGELDQRVRQQFQRPAGATRRWTRAGGGD